MPDAIQGIHHVTAIASDPQANVNFYEGVLGLRLVKRTINFDDPGTYHLYYGDHTGQPGTILTFFPYPRAFQGQHGTRQIMATALSIAPESIDFWIDRLRAHNVRHETPITRFDVPMITLFDPDGLVIELVATPESGIASPWRDGPVPEAHAIRGLHGVTMALASADASVEFLRDVMAFETGAIDGDRQRYTCADAGQHIDLIALPDVAPGRVAAGSVHHVAFRVPDDAAQADWYDHIHATELHVTSPVDRHYFRSIYFREPGGVLFEIATNAPGLAYDEDIDALGSRLMLPPWLEARRAQLERRLRTLQRPRQSEADAGASSDSVG